MIRLTHYLLDMSERDILKRAVDWGYLLDECPTHEVRAWLTEDHEIARWHEQIAQGLKGSKSTRLGSSGVLDRGFTWDELGSLTNLIMAISSSWFGPYDGPPEMAASFAQKQERAQADCRAAIMLLSGSR